MYNSPTAPIGTRLNSLSSIYILLLYNKCPMEEESILSSFLMEHMDTHVSVGPYASINCSMTRQASHTHHEDPLTISS